MVAEVIRDICSTWLHRYRSRMDRYRSWAATVDHSWYYENEGRRYTHARYCLFVLSLYGSLCFACGDRNIFIAQANPDGTFYL